eukprot:TRINITY_DN10769_c0_g1_i1.p1 TRINITY_DN10769_c0_g1~~TRINITY_DN10769_c0_g1_i1.p1  ORF type:complete len:107 (+),score=12.01 TRINITY_DN10769_c0_g1_i1:121-441(+)
MKNSYDRRKRKNLFLRPSYTSSLVPPSWFSRSQDNICYGQSCFSLTFVIAGSTVISAMIALALLGRDLQHEQHFQKEGWKSESENDLQTPTTKMYATDANRQFKSK